MQDRMGKLHPIAYASRSLTKAEKNYAVTELEGLGVVWALRHFRDYIFGYEITVCTDHRPLVGLFTNKSPTGKFARWLLTVQEFNPLFKYLPGKQNYVADALSRNVFLTSVFPCMDMDELKREQRDDPLWSNVISYLTHDIANLTVKLPVPLRELFMHDGLLCRSATLGVPARSVTQVVVPHKLIPNVLRLVHDTPQLAHPAKDRCLKQTRLRYFWPCMAKDIALYINRCLVCNSHKGTASAPQRVLQYPKPNQPWERVSMDTLGGLATTEKGNKYLLVVIDTFTRYCELIPISDKSAATVSLAFKIRIIDRYGCPKYLVTDNGGEFNNAMMDKLCELYRISHCNILPHHPASNGLAERLNRKIISHLTANINFQHDNWDDCMSDVQSSLNASYHKSIRETPHFALFGYDKVLPYEIWTAVRSTRYASDDPVGDRFRQTQLIHQRIASDLQRETDVFVDEANRRSRATPDLVGNLVMLRNFTRTNKTEPRYIGPYRVLEHVTGHRYKLKHVHSGTVREDHADNVKLLHYSDEFSADNSDNDDANPDNPATDHVSLPSSSRADPPRYNLRPRK